MNDDQTLHHRKGSNCHQCLPGWFARMYASTRCEPCDKGIQVHRFDAVKTCISYWLAGSYNPRYGASECTACGAGRYCLVMIASDSSSCLICPDGFYCPDAINSEPQPCPKNTYVLCTTCTFVTACCSSYCKAGSSTFTPCPLLMESDQAATVCFA
jgi:hypothetical protein